MVAFALGLPLLAGTSGPDLAGSDVLRAALGGLLAAVLCAILGVGIGVLVRNQVAGVVATLCWFFIVEPLIPLISDDAAKATVGQAASAVGGATQGNVLAIAPALAVLVVWAFVFVAAVVLVDQRRDVS